MRRFSILSICLMLFACISGLSQTNSKNPAPREGRVPGGVPGGVPSGIPGGVIGGVPGGVSEFPAIPAPSNVKTVVRTKDGVIIGRRDEFIANCASNTSNTFKFKDVEIDSAKYCTCFTDNIIPKINSWEFVAAVKNNKIAELLTDDKYYSTLLLCLDDNFKPGQNYKFGDSGDIELEKKLGVKQCTTEVLKNFSQKNNVTQARAKAYCECTTEKLVKGGYNINDLSELDDFNSAAFKEIIVPCIDLIIKPENNDPINERNEVEGSSQQSSVPLMISGNLYKIKLSIAGASEYYLIDTGATDLIINRETERALLIAGGLKMESYLNKTEYVLANNQSVQAQMVRIESIVIGDYTVKNIIAAVIDDSNLICGNSFLEKFQKWVIDKRTKRLILYK